MPEHGPADAYVAVVPVLDTSGPNFGPAGWRVVEAWRRFRELQQLMPELTKEWQGELVARAPKGAPQELQLSFRDWSTSQMPSARALTLLASEVLHHARIALDYCAYHVVWVDGGRPRDKTKFPLVTEQERWGKEKRDALPGVTAEHAEWVRDVQPFADVNWSRNLVELSNRDKHRMAVEVIPVYRCKVNRERLYADPLGDPEYWGFAVSDPRLELTIASAMTAEPGSRAGMPWEETLAKILLGVTELVNRFLTESGYKPISVSFDDDRGDREMYE